MFPSIINYWYRFSHEGVRIVEVTDDDSIAGHFLHTLLGEAPSELHEAVMNVSLILYAEHEFNASTFTARVCASTLSDMHSCITGAIGSGDPSTATKPPWNLSKSSIQRTLLSRA